MPTSSLHVPPCSCATCRASFLDDSFSIDAPALLPGGFTPRNLTHRFCHECLAVTKHTGTNALRSSCTLCGADYSSKAPASAHGAALWASAQAEIKQLKKIAPRVRHGRIIPSGGVNVLLGITETIVLPD